MTRNRKIVLASLTFLLPLLVIATLTLREQSGIAREEQRLEEVLARVGEFVRANREVFSEGLQAPTGDVPPEEVVARVNGLPISWAELQLRFVLNKASGLGPQSLNEVFNRVVREKVLIKEAINLGLLATDEEVAEFIAKEKKQAEEDEEYAAGVNKIISA